MNINEQKNQKKNKGELCQKEMMGTESESMFKRCGTTNGS